MEIFEFLWMEGWERTESPYPKMDTSKNGLFRWVDDLPKFWGLTVIWLKYIPNDFDSKSKLSKWEHNLSPWFLDIQSWKMLCNANSSHIHACMYVQASAEDTGPCPSSVSHFPTAFSSQVYWPQYTIIKYGAAAQLYTFGTSNGAVVDRLNPISPRVLGPGYTPDSI